MLAAIMQMVEQADGHRDHLQRAPLMGHSRDYLAELAAQMTMQGDVTIVEARARSIIHSVSHGLGADGQIATVPEPGEHFKTGAAPMKSMAYRFSFRGGKSLKNTGRKWAPHT